MANNTGKIIIGIVAIIVIVGLIAIFSIGKAKAPATTTIAATSAFSTIAYNNTNTTATTTVKPSNSTSSYSAPVMITDPPQVPSGASALVIAYSSVMVNVSGGSNSGWANASGNGTINLLTVVNSSKVIGYTNVSANSTINLVRLNVVSANITVNGTTYNVTLPSSNVTIAVASRTKLNSSSGVLVDFAPVVHAIYSQNSTTFVMAPSARATVVANVSASALGSSVSLSAGAKAKLENAAPNISITNASVLVSGNVTTLSVTVKDNSNSSVVLNNLVVQGSQKASVAQSANLNVSIRGSVNGLLNSNASNHANANAQANALAKLGLNVEQFNTLFFVVSSNSTLAVPTGVASIRSSGLTLAPNASTTLSFNGVVAYDSGAIQAVPKSGSQQQITVKGQDGASASTVVAAK